MRGPTKSDPRSWSADDRERRRLASAVGDEAAGRPGAQLAVPGLPAVEDVVQDPGAAGLGEELGAEADQAARRDEVLHPRPPGAVVDHLLHPALAQREELRDDADVLLRDVDRDALHRLVLLAVDLAGQHLRLADGELEPLAPHDLDEHRELELAAALHFPDVRARRRLHAQGDVPDELPLEPGDQRARRHLVALGPGERGRVDPQGHGQGRLVDGAHRKRPRIVQVRDRLADRHLGQAGERDDLAGARLVGGDAVERLRDVELGHLRLLDRPVRPAPGDLLALADRPVQDSQQGEAAHVRRSVEVRDERLQRMVRVVRGRRNRCEQSLDERPEVGGELIGLEAGLTGACVRVHDRELDLRLVGVEVEEELVDLVDDLCRPGVGAVDLVHDEDDRELRLERLAQHEPRLRQRPLARIDEEQHTVDHGQAALDFAAEVGVTRRVDDVHLDVADLDRRVLGEDRDALFALEVHRVHDALGDVLIRPEGTGLPQQGVDERRLAVVDVRDDRDVPQIVAASKGWSGFGHESHSTGGTLRPWPATSKNR